MKKAGVTLFLLAAFFTNAQTSNVAFVNADVLQLKELSHDFGKIPQGKPVYYQFEVVNKSSAPLKLDAVTASCGCTTPTWNHEPIAPGSSSVITVGYNAASEGYFEKMITITYNTDKSKQLTIKGTVWKTPVGSAPLNASVQFLKQINQ